MAKSLVRTVRFHSYHNVMRSPGDLYLIDNDQDLETVLAHGVAAKEDMPETARHPAEAPNGQPVAPLSTSSFIEPSNETPKRKYTRKS